MRFQFLRTLIYSLFSLVTESLYSFMFTLCSSFAVCIIIRTPAAKPSSVKLTKNIGKVSKKSSVKVTSSFFIERYSHVMHIVSNVEGFLKSKVSSIQALMSGFPAGTVSGAPKIRAMQIIDELENSKRGVYAGGIGYLSANNNMDTCIALRTCVIKNNELYVQSGGGIVYDSDPQKEYEETVNKAKAIINAAEISLGNNI